MRTLALLTAIGLALLTACSSGDNSGNQAVDQAALADSLKTVDENLIQAASTRLIGDFQASLQGRLMKAIASGGATGAIGECRIAAPGISDSMSLEGWIIKRVSDKNRNPDNRPTLAERNILAVFGDTSQPNKKFYGEWITEDSVTYYTYYKPIYVKNLCLKCHGDLQTLAPGVYQAVKEDYPTDKATGYKEGELRGMFVVRANWPEGRQFAQKIIDGTAFKGETVDIEGAAESGK